MQRFCSKTKGVSQGLPPTASGYGIGLSSASSSEEILAMLRREYPIVGKEKGVSALSCPHLEGTCPWVSFVRVASKRKSSETRSHSITVLPVC